jgi:hypothetical protein
VSADDSRRHTVDSLALTASEELTSKEGVLEILFNRQIDRQTLFIHYEDESDIRLLNSVLGLYANLQSNYMRNVLAQNTVLYFCISSHA